MKTHYLGILVCTLGLLLAPGCGSGDAGGDIKATPEARSFDTGIVEDGLTRAPDSANPEDGHRTTPEGTEDTSAETSLPANCAASPETLAACVDIDHYQTELEFATGIRPPGSVHWQEVQDRCVGAFQEYGYEVHLHQYGDNDSGINVIGTMQGTTLPDEKVVVSAHYDHIEGCEGADDNATGVAGLLETARVLAMASFERTLIVACWDEEEWGMVGSFNWVVEASTAGKDIKMSYVYEMLGYYTEEPGTQEIPMGMDFIFPEEIQKLEDNEFRGDFVAVVGDEWSHEPTALMLNHAEAIGLKAITLELGNKEKLSPIFAPLRRSDHSSFWKADYPAVMITDTANYRNLNYHCGEGPDSVERLTPEFTEGILKATVYSAAVTLGHQAE